MHDEDVTLIGNHDDLESYIEENPDDLSALVFGAYFDDKKRWQDEIDQINGEIADLQWDKIEWEKELDEISTMKHYWRKYISKENCRDSIQLSLINIEEAEEKLWKRVKYLWKNPPEDWRYKLAINGNNLFTAR